MTKKQQFAFIVMAGDYHELDLGSIIQGHKFKIHELGMFERDYVGLAYTGKRPPQKEIDQMLIDVGIELNDCSDYEESDWGFGEED